MYLSRTTLLLLSILKTSKVANLSTMTCVKVSHHSLIENSRNLAPELTSSLHKGQAGRIGVFGGSIEFTGAPYFASFSALKVGADLAYVFTTKDAAQVIKSYSPELMVLPYLDDPDGIHKMDQWIDRLHVALIGPGMGRAEATKKMFQQIIAVCAAKKLPLIIDADGLFFIAQTPTLLKDYPAHVILTPNKMELTRLLHNHTNEQAFLSVLGPKVTLFIKDAIDQIVSLNQTITISGGGSNRRCGGQGDMLGGTMAVFMFWALQKKWEPAVACYAASKLTRDCNGRAFQKMGRAMLVTDMIKEIVEVFKEEFELRN